MTTTENVKSETILREVRERILTLVKNPPRYDSDITLWDTELRALLHAEIVYSRPEIIPLVDHTGDTRYQVRL